MAIRSVLIRWIIFSDGLRNHRGTITNTRAIDTTLATCAICLRRFASSFPCKRKSKHERAVHTAHGRIRHSRVGGNLGIGFSETLRICRTVKLPPARRTDVSKWRYGASLSDGLYFQTASAISEAMVSLAPRWWRIKPSAQSDTCPRSRSSESHCSVILRHSSASRT